MKFFIFSLLFNPLYILPAQSILKKCYEKIIHFKSPITINGYGERTIMNEEVRFEIKIILDGENFRVETSLPRGKEIIIKNKGKIVRIAVDKEVSLTTSFGYLPEILNFLLFSNDYRIEKFGIDTSTVSFTREKEKGIIAYSIGARDGFLEVNQFWVNKNSFLPVRFIYIKDGKIYDIKFTGFNVKDGDKFFPDRFEFSDPEGKGSLVFKGWEKVEKLDPSIFAVPSGLKPKSEREESIEELIKRFEER